MSDAASDRFADMTLAQLEELAARLGAAVKTIHEAQSLLGGGGSVSSPRETGEPAAAPDPGRLFRAPEQAPQRHPVLSAAEVNQRNALLGRSNGLSDEDMEALKR